MTLRRIQVTDFRCLYQAEMELDPRFTLLSGPNASGKTSLLEAIYVLGRGRSFRTRRLDQLIRAGAERLNVLGEVDVAGRRVTLGVSGSQGRMRARLAGEGAASLADLALVFPVQIIDPEIHHLIEEGPGRRRRFLDWGVFHVEPGFVASWRKYHQVLKQRNAALRSGQPRSLVAAWDTDLVRYGEVLTDARHRYVEQLATIAGPLGQRLLGKQLSLAYRRGWTRELGFAEALVRSWDQDQEAASTQVGPQRAELVIKLDGFTVKDRISRGQQKLLAGVLLISQLRLFPLGAPVRPTLLLDDPAAELDDERLARLIEEVRAQPLQLIVTTLHSEFSALGIPGRSFRIEAGVVQPL